MSLLSFSHIFCFVIWPFSSFFIFFYFCKFRSLIPTCGGVIVFIILSSLGQCSNNEDHHTFIYLQLKITTQYLWHPGSEQLVYHALPAQRSCLLATHNILVQKTTALLMLANHSSYYNRWRGQAAHTVRLNNMYII